MPMEKDGVIIQHKEEKLQVLYKNTKNKIDLDLHYRYTKNKGTIIAR